MEAHVNVRLAVEETSQVGAARRAALELAAAAGLGESERSNLAIVVTEAAGNLVKHAGGGWVLLRALEPQHNARRGVEVLCVDRGPGIANVAASMRDGYSTTGTLGGGLGAIRRMADEFDLHSAPGHGTALMARVHASGTARNGAGPLEVGAAAAVASVEPGGAVRYCGAGNTSGSVYGPDSHVHMVSQPGTLGHVAPRPRAFDYRVGRAALIVMHTDGISARWSLDAYPGLAQRHPSLIAAVLYRDFGRDSDDATVLVARVRA